MDYEGIAKRIGNIPTGEAVLAADVRDELRSKSYVVQGGKLSPTELFRLGVYAKRRTIKRVVDEAFALDAVREKQVVAPKRPLAMAKGFDPLYDQEVQKRFKLEAWAGYRAGLIR